MIDNEFFPYELRTIRERAKNNKSIFVAINLFSKVSLPTLFTEFVSAALVKHLRWIHLCITNAALHFS